MPEHELLTVREVAEYLRLSEYTVREMIKAKQITGAKFGRAYRIRKSEVDRVLKEREQRPQAA